MNMSYKIIFSDGGVLSFYGSVEYREGVFRCYGEDRLIKLLIPIEKVKYIERT